MRERDGEEKREGRSGRERKREEKKMREGKRDKQRASEMCPP